MTTKEVKKTKEKKISLSLEERRLLELKEKFVTNDDLEESFVEFCTLYPMFICRGASTLMINFKQLEKIRDGK